MAVTVLKPGDKVRHPKRPEWGIGEVTRIEMVTRNGQPDQRAWIRFPSVGLKTLLVSVAAPEPVLPEGEASLPARLHEPTTLVDLEAQREGGWLGEITKKRPEQAMTSLPPRATDPFLSAAKRMEHALSLYRFTASGPGLIEWAIAQSGLDDPLSRFTRHELEVFFQRWRHELDLHTARLLQELRRDRQPIEPLLARAPAAAVAALKRVQQLRV